MIKRVDPTGVIMRTCVVRSENFISQGAGIFVLCVGYAIKGW